MQVRWTQGEVSYRLSAKRKRKHPNCLKINLVLLFQQLGRYYVLFNMNNSNGSRKCQTVGTVVVGMKQEVSVHVR
jgi:hypothetical protein